MIMMKISYVCLILLTYICVSRGEDPIQNVSCDIQGILTATLTPNSPWTLPENATCGQKQVIKKKQDTGTFTISGCTIGTKVVLVLTKPDQEEKSPARVVFTPTKETMTVTLTCNALNGDVTLEAKMLGIPIIETVTDDAVIKTAIETIDMIMELRAASGSNTKVTSMNLNGTYSLWIAGAGNHSTKVKGCTAAPADSSTESVSIYPSGTPKVLETFKSNNVQSKTTTNGKMVNQIATLTGFRLVGSSTVFFKCTINVCAHECPTQSTSQTRSQGRSPTPSDSAGKKRKGGKHPSSVHYATLKLNVRDTLLGTSTNGATDTFPIGRNLVKFIVLITTIAFIY